ncbi:oligosaccharide flippase family protein [Methylomonas sp. SURF-1]|uniref:Oligosaccharide flippase family protein n=1 Tax=Methylomonas aurea TaxID=2952224 RepID=A0ABT1UHK6_9GAMM|nr:oligosaccharide flippase family protein [Methylomonas sp. SURF-1]MCQ8181702.1 oligosaccharide flippase family protein [Methylomonas sp. SURF-1]
MPRVFREFKNNTILNRFVRIIGVDGFVKVSGFILLPIYLKLMTQEEYAEFSYVMSVVSTFGLIFNFGLYVPQVKLYQDADGKEKGSVLFTINITLLVMLVLALGTFYIFNLDNSIINLLFSSSETYLRHRVLILIGLVVSVFSCMLIYFYIANEFISKVQAYNVLRFLVGVSVALFGLYCVSGNKADVRMKSYLFSEIIVILLFLRRYVKEMKLKFDIDIAMRSLQLGGPIMMSAILGIFVNFSDKFFIEKYCSLTDMSVYYVSLTYGGIITAVFAAFQNAWLPLFLKERDVMTNFYKTKKMLKTLFISFIFLSVVLWVMQYVFILYRIIDEKYYRVLMISPFQMISSMFLSLSGLLSNYTIYWNMTYITTVFGIVVSFIGVPLYFYGAKLYGIQGVSVAGVIAGFLYFSFYLLFVCSKINILARR